MADVDFERLVDAELRALRAQLGAPLPAPLPAPPDRGGAPSSPASPRSASLSRYQLQMRGSGMADGAIPALVEGQAF